MDARPSQKLPEVDHCLCGLHCRLECPYFYAAIQEGGVIVASCDKYRVPLAYDERLLRLNHTVFFRTKGCKDKHAGTLVSKELDEQLN